MIKYPSIYTPSELEKRAGAEVLRALRELEAFVEPKFDGSNITVVEGSFFTRNLNPLPPRFAEGLRRALGDSFSALVELSRESQVFLELGGYENSPAGYEGGWSRDWDYRIFDLARGGKFLPPPEVARICGERGLEFVGYRVVRFGVLLDEWPRLLREYGAVEGFVAKLFPPAELLEGIKYHRTNMLAVKFKHEYLGARPAKKAKRKKRRGEIAAAEARPEMPDSEVLGAINRVHLQIGDAIADKKRAMPLIFRAVKEEAEKHGYAVPKASRLFKLYLRYLESL